VLQQMRQTAPLAVGNLMRLASAVQG